MLGRAYTHSVDENLQSHLDTLLDRLNQNEDVGLELDRYFPVIWMQRRGVAITTQWQDYILHPNDVFTVHHLVDIGHTVRQITTQQTSTSLLFRVVQYCMPYIKHNRLCFSCKKTDADLLILPELVKIMLATCLGLYRTSMRKPLWAHRVQIAEVFYEILAHASVHDMFIFCENHLALLRISMMEYFVYFVNANMPVECGMLPAVFNLNCELSELFAQFKTTIDTFRQNSFQSTELHWATAIQNATFACEKCNRISKSKTRFNRQNTRQSKSTVAGVTRETIRRAMSMPRTQHPAYLKSLDATLSASIVEQIHLIHNCITVYNLPKNLKDMQTRRILQILETKPATSLRPMWFYICLACARNSCKSNKIRMCGSQGVTCGNCRQTDCVVKINLLGRIVTVLKQAYYYCMFCHQVHQWAALGTEFVTCPKAPKSISYRQHMEKTCFMCTRSVNLMPFDCLDEYLGVCVNIQLCARHFPPPHLHSIIYNYDSLVAAQSQKRTRFL